MGSLFSWDRKPQELTKPFNGPSPYSGRMTGAEGARRHLLTYSVLAAVMTVAAWCHGLLFDRYELAFIILVPSSFLGLGMMIKYGDQAYDADAYSKRNTLLLALPGGIWMGSLMAVDAGSATIFVGILFALLLAGKLDNLPFRIGFVVAMGIMAAALLLGLGSMQPVGALVILAFAYVDERSNDLPCVDRGQGWKAAVLHNRPFLKAAVLALCLIGVLPSLLYFFAFLAFDLGYSAVEAFSLRKEVPSLG
jgi:hypothetical protein